MVTALDWLAWLGLGAVIVAALWVEKRHHHYRWRDLLQMRLADEDETE